MLPLVIAVTLLGCATVSEDMKLSDLAFDELSKGHYQQAETYLEEALSLNPDNPYALLNMGVVYQNTGRRIQARLMYIKVIAHSPEAKATRSNSQESTGKSLVEIARENFQGVR